MWYLVTGLVCVFLIWKDSKKREGSIVKHAVLSVLVPPLGYALWQAEKPLVGDEKRYGGKGWNLMKWIAIMHTVLCIIWAVYGMMIGAEVASGADSEYGVAGAAIGTFLGLGMIAFVWFGGVVGSLVLGLILKKPVTETATGVA